MKRKRVISLLIVLMMVLSMIPLTVYAAYENTWKNTGDQRTDIIEVAKTQLGYPEGYDNDNKYGAYFGHNHVAWCAYFVSWCARQANIPESVLKTSSGAVH